MVDDAVGAVVEVAVDALEVVGSLGDSSSRRRRRPGCGWYALIGVILTVIGFVVAVALQRG